MDKKIVVCLLMALIAATLLFGLASNRGLFRPLAPKPYHAHFDFKLFVDGKQVDLSQDPYQSVEGHELNEDVHLHDHDGEVVHLHAHGVTVREFLEALKLLPEAGKQARVFANGKETPAGLAYQPQDLDRVLVSVGAGTDEQVAAWMALVSDRACIYSEKCPERGKPPYETCVGQQCTID